MASHKTVFLCCLSLHPDGESPLHESHPHETKKKKKKWKSACWHRQAGKRCAKKRPEFLFDEHLQQSMNDLIFFSAHWNRQKESVILFSWFNHFRSLLNLLWLDFVWENVQVIIILHYKNEEKETTIQTNWCTKVIKFGRHQWTQPPCFLTCKFSFANRVE